MEEQEEEVIDLIDFSRAREGPNTIKLHCRYTGGPGIRSEYEIMPYTPRTQLGENVLKSLLPDDHTETMYQPPYDELEKKVDDFLEEVRDRRSVLGGMIFKGQENQTALELFMDCVSKANHKLMFIARGRKYEMYVDNNLAVETYNANYTVFIKPLVDAAFELLQNECFIIMQTVLYECVTAKDIEKAEDPKHTDWVYPTRPENFIKIIARETWGGNSHNKILMDNIEDTIKDFVYSDSLSLLCFDSDFTSAERRSIHNISKELKLRCEDVGSGIQTKTKVYKHHSREALVRILLRSNCERTVYRLIIPPNFANLWSQIFNPNENS
ncbi:uncharacterized protein LOC126264537 [Aethina tumida]|uniref:uncharacterized protein LOC126264537 n=1 Tax=Aethina tumida TaxID=116153 RepID=UPI002147CFC9|nr:uncharacterized protein LOC126264537 [Aethina tumida]